ncbi:MAG: hypothetical protein L0226_01355 [Acidobacteria bacterium]|nr:hypothetical protein [Acidobacteriota bacterium]
MSRPGQNDCGLRTTDCGLRIADCGLIAEIVSSNPQSAIRNPQSNVSYSLFVLALLLCTQFIYAFARDDYPRNAAIDAIHYRLRLMIRETSEEIQAEAEILFELKEDGVKTIALDLRGLTVVQVTEDKRAAKFTRADGRVQISLSGSYRNLGMVKREGADLELYYYLFPRDRDKGIKGYGRALQMIEFYSNLIGPFPYEKLALVQSSTRYGGMENASNIFLAEDTFGEGVVAHEIAHQWFGDAVTEADWHHLWLSEGFATYFGHLFFERADGRDKFVQLMLNDKESYLKEYGKDPPPIYDPSITDLLKLLNANSYQKGGWVLHMLRYVMGDEKFFAGIRDYYRTYRDRNALTDDFRKVMEFHYGQPLAWFFKQWIFESGYPIYEAVWKWDESTRELRIRVRQKQEKTVFRMPVEIEIKAGKEVRREVIKIDEREQNFTFKLDAKPQGLTIDPDEWLLKVANVSEVK